MMIGWKTSRRTAAVIGINTPKQQQHTVNNFFILSNSIDMMICFSWDNNQSYRIICSNNIQN